MIQQDARDEFRDLSIKMVEWMRKNATPHDIVVVEQNCAQLFFGELSTGMIPFDGK